MTELDCVFIPGGGLLLDGSLPPWTLARLDRALTLKSRTRWIGLLSGGTVHKPSPLDPGGYPVFESRAAANYLIESGLNPGQILTEICSYDTIGNAYFSRLLFAEPLQLKKLLVITSAFHLPRTKFIFRWIYSLEPTQGKIELHFESVPDSGLSAAALAARNQREKTSLKNLAETRSRIITLAAFTEWLYTEHGAYAPEIPEERLSSDELKSY